MLLRKNKARWRVRRAGYVLILIAVLVLLIAWNTGTNLFYLIFAGLASLLLISVFIARRSLRGIRVVRHAPEGSRAAMRSQARVPRLIEAAWREARPDGS